MFVLKWSVVMSVGMGVIRPYRLASADNQRMTATPSHAPLDQRHSQDQYALFFRLGPH
ncbi:MAG: hypothetical protein QNJ97_03625 [Myxococcota bacterium]|nr:hypothetical protein [Myxococcota bacterium]